jgi:hypothetical protein
MKQRDLMSRYIYLLILLLFSAAAVNAEMYRWTDENGNVHYSDKIPAQQKHLGHMQLNKQGVIIETVEKSLTPAQLQHLMQEKKLHRLQQEFQLQLRNRDQSLLEQFDSADDLIMTREGMSAKMERSIGRLKKKADDSRKSLAKQQKRIDAIQARGEPVSVDMIHKLLSLRHSVEKSNSTIALAEIKKQQMLEQYSRDLQRYRHLKEPDEHLALEVDESLAGVIACSFRESCKLLWKRAVVYVKKHSDTAVKYQTDEIIITERATQEQQISLILSLIGEADKERFSIYLDVLCRASARGAPCDSEQAKSVLQDFRQAVLNETMPAPESASNPPAHAVATP